MLRLCKRIHFTPKTSEVLGVKGHDACNFPSGGSEKKARVSHTPRDADVRRQNEVKRPLSVTLGKGNTGVLGAIFTFATFLYV